jgi:hypothetical protein
MPPEPDVRKLVERSELVVAAFDVPLDAPGQPACRPELFTTTISPLPPQNLSPFWRELFTGSPDIRPLW